MFISFRHASVVITHSKYLQNYVRRYGSRNLAATYFYGVDTDSFKPMDVKKQAGFTILYAGRFSVQKGVDHLVEAFRMLKDTGLKFRVLMYGQGPLRQLILNAAEKNHLDIQLSGYLDQESLVLKMNEADVFVVPSTSEGLGFIAAEALSCGLPVVASEVGGLPDSVGGYGILIPPRNPRAIADALLDVHERYGVYRKKALEGRNHIIERFDRKRVVKEFQDALEGVVVGNR